MEKFTSEEVYQQTLERADRLSVLSPEPSDERTQYYEKMGVLHTPTQVAPPLLRQLATPGADLLLIKPELDQAVGSYKIRGSSAAVAACLRQKPTLQSIHTA